MEEMRNLEDLLKHELEDLYSAEQQIIDALPALIEKASDAKLKKSLQQHLKVTKQQKERLDKVKKLLGEEVSQKEPGFFAKLFNGGEEGPEHCKAMEGLVKEGEKLMAEDATSEVQDAAIIAACQKIEHYEISSYGTARAYALHLGMKDVARLLTQTLNEEYEADTVLNELAMGKVNLEADEGLQSLRKIPGGESRGKVRSDASSTSRSTGRKAPGNSGGKSGSGSSNKSNTTRSTSPRGGKSGGRTKSKASTSKKRTSGTKGRK